MKKKEVSLIVLSITILVMAILAATVIISLEDSGIIGRAKSTVKNTSYSDEYTRLIVIKNGILTDNLGTITLEEYIAELQNKGIIENGVITNADGSKTVVTKSGYEITLSQAGVSDLKVEQGKSNAPSITMIKFTIEGVEYQAESGMTFETWLGSKYNTLGGMECYESSGSVLIKNTATSYTLRKDTATMVYEHVYANEVIKDGMVTYWKNVKPAPIPQ